MGIGYVLGFFYKFKTIAMLDNAYSYKGGGSFTTETTGNIITFILTFLYR